MASSLRSLVFLVTLLFLSISSPSNATCPSPLILPIQNNTLSSGGVRRGVGIKVGGQQFSLLPRAASANVYLSSDPTSCSTIQCSANNRGVFDTSKSSSWRLASSQEAAGAANQQFGSPADWGDDTIELPKNPGLGSWTVDNVPLGLGSTSSGDLGLNINSTFLHRLEDSGVIPSRSYGLAFGSTDGSDIGIVVLGGYDSARTTGPGLTLPLITRNCSSGLLLSITRMSLVNHTGSTDILGNSGLTELDACIDDAVEGFILPKIVNQNIKLNFDPRISTFNTSQTPDYEMQVTLNGNLTIRIPNSQLFMPPMDVDESGQMVADYTQRTMNLIDWTGMGSGPISRLGRSFLSAAYISGDYTTNQFTVWANGGNATMQQKIQTIKGKCGGSGNATSSGTDSTTSTTSGSTANATAANASNGDSGPSDTSLNAGAIAGIAIGGLLALLLAALVAFLIYPRRKRRVHNPESPYNSRLTSNVVEKDGANISEAPFTDAGRTELSGSVGRWPVSPITPNGRCEMGGGTPIGLPEKPELLGNQMDRAELAALSSGVPTGLRQPKSAGDKKFS